MFNEKKEFRAILVQNSPIEFVLSGPYGGRDRVLIKSSNASVDLIAMVSEGYLFEFRRAGRSNAIARFLGGEGRNVNLVSSQDVHDFFPESDSRLASLKLAWVGLASPVKMSVVESVFRRCTPQLLESLHFGTAEDVEYSVAPVVLACSEANESQKSRFRAMRLLLGAYSLLALFALAYTFAKGLH